MAQSSARHRALFLSPWVFLFAAMILFIWRLSYVVLYPDPRVFERRDAQYWGESVRSFDRMDIYDRNGMPLAISVPSYGIFIDPAFWEDTDESMGVMRRLAGKEYGSVVARIKEPGVRFVWLARDVDAETMREAVKTNGVFSILQSRRIYPLGPLAGHVVGFCNTDGKGLAGAEKYFDKDLYLPSAPFRFRRWSDGYAEADYPRNRLAAEEGHSAVTLSLDSRIQTVVHGAVSAAALNHRAAWAAAIMMDISNGEILSMYSWPDFDPGERASLKGDRIRNNAVGRVYEPGSVFKILPMVAALQNGMVVNGEKFNCSGKIVVAGSTIRCTHKHGLQTVLEVVQNSCNVAMSQIGMRFGSEELRRTLDLWGLGERTGVEIGGEETGILQEVSSMRKTSLANIAIGQGVAVTPLQMVRIVSAVANGGELIRPTIIAGKPSEVSGGVCSPSVAATVREGMRMVAVSGTGKAADSKLVEIAGKTGTSQVARDGRYVPGLYVASFAGFWPYETPRYAMVVIIGEPSGGDYYGGVVAAPVFREIVDTIVKAGLLP